MRYDLDAEWLEADGLGGFASGTVSGIRTRRYHALILAATTPPGGRMVLVNGIEVWATTARGRFALTSQRYGRDVIYPDGASHIRAFEVDPWPRQEVVHLGGDRGRIPADRLRHHGAVDQSHFDVRMPQPPEHRSHEAAIAGTEIRNADFVAP